MPEHRLRVGQSLHLKKSFFKTTCRIIYGGMPNDSCYSLVVATDFGYNSMAYNLYLRVDQKDVELKYGHLRISHISPREIIFSLDN